MDLRSDRRATLEAKKAKLAALRADKQRREAAKKSATTTPTATSIKKVVTKKSPDTEYKAKRQETDELLESLKSINDPATSATTLPEPTSSVSHAPIPQTTPTTTPQKPRPLPKLTKSSITILECSNRETISYAKETQTAEIIQTQVDPDDDYDTTIGPRDGVSQKHEKKSDEQVPDSVDQGIADVEEPPEVPKVKELSPEENEQIVKSDDFWSFLDKTSRYIERAITETNVDIMTDYQLDGNEGDLLDPMHGEALSYSRVFNDPTWTSGRVVSQIEWSTIHPELCYASYGAKTAGGHNDPKGIVAVWNTKFKKDTPEFLFHCQSPITSLTLCPYSPSLIIGGTYSGQVVIWDNRSRKRSPVQRSKYGQKSHTHPVFCLDIVGSLNAHNLISTSSDGRVCSWSLDMLAQPQDTFDLVHPFDKRRNISVLCSSFPKGNVNQFILGCEDGGVYQAQRHGQKSGITEMFGSGNVGSSAYSGGLGGGQITSGSLAGYVASSSMHSMSLAHSGPVFGLSTHKASGALDFSDLFLTCSADWSIKLWSTKSITSSTLSSATSSSPNTSITQSSTQTTTNPIISEMHTFENNQEYIYDISWSPSHPGVFCCGDGEGNLDLWNINTHTEIPTATYKLRGGASTISKLSWSGKGDFLAAGDNIGRIELLEVNEQLYQPKQEEWHKFMEVTQDLLQSSQEESRTDLTSKYVNSSFSPSRYLHHPVGVRDAGSGDYRK